MNIEQQKLKLFLLDSGLVSDKDILGAEKQAQKTKKDLGEVLVNQGKISEEDLGRLYAYILGIPFVSLMKGKIDPNVLSLIPEPIARTHNIVAYKKDGNELEVAMLNPQDLETIDFIKKNQILRFFPG